MEGTRMRYDDIEDEEEDETEEEDAMGFSSLPYDSDFPEAEPFSLLNTC
jgi:hypothetical protein